MAVEIKKNITFNVSERVKFRLQAFQNARVNIQIQNDFEFYQRVTNEGLSFTEQKAYRQAQLDKEMKRAVRDGRYIKLLKAEVSNLVKQVRIEKFRKDYQNSLTSLADERINLQDHLKFLEKQLQNIKDPELAGELRASIVTSKKAITQSDNAYLNNKIELAKRDQSLVLLNKSLEDVEMERAEALAVGDKERVSALDLKRQSINESITAVKVQDSLNDLTIERSRGAGAMSYLQSLVKRVNEGDSASPVVINGVRYNSERDFWASARDTYLADSFFTELGQEYDNYIRNVSQLNGQVPNNSLINIQKDFDNLATRGELAPFANRLNILKTDVLSTAVQVNAQGIINEFNNDLDVNKALTGLENLQEKFGISQTSNIQTIVQNFAQERAPVVQDFLSQVASFVQEGMSFQSAINSTQQLIDQGKLISAPVSSQEILSQTPEEIARAAPGKTQAAVKEKVVAPAKPGVQEKQTPGQRAGITEATPQGVAQQEKLAVDIPSGVLVRNAATGQIFFTDKGQRRLITSPQVLTEGAGFVNVPEDVISGLQEGVPISQRPSFLFKGQEETEQLLGKSKISFERPTF